MKHWSVEIKVNGESILFISHNELSGVDNAIDYTDEIRHCALNLLGFIGESEAAYKPARHDAERTGE